MTPDTRTAFYSALLSRIHHEGFGDYARDAAPGLLALLRARGIHDGLVVDLGCGSGIWAAALLQAGYRVTGVDVSRPMLDIARTVAPGAELVLASILDFPIPPCAAVTALGEPLGYIVDRDPALGDVFARVHHALAPGGLFVFDLVVADPESEPMNYARTVQGKDWTVDVLVEERPELALVTREIRTRRVTDPPGSGTLEVHRVRTYPPGRIVGALESLGFRVDTTESFGSLRLAPRRLAFIAQK